MKTVSLSSVAKIIMGQSPPSSVYNTVGKGLPFFQGKTDFGELYPKPRIYCTAPKKVAEQGDILISVRAPVGPTNIAPAKSCIGRGLAAIRPKAGIAQKYLLYFLRYHEADLARRGRGSTFEAIGRSDLEEITLPLPPLEEQKRIAGILARADRVRQMRRFALQMTDDYLQAVFLRMFGDPVMNPMGWKCANMGSQIDSIRYGTGSPPPYQPSGIPFIRATNVKGGTIQSEDLAFISRESARGLEKCKVSAGNLIIVRSGVNSGDCALIPPHFNNAYAAYDLIVEVTYPKNYYYNFMINSDFGKAIIGPITRRAGQPHINAEQVSSLNFILPPDNLLEQFVSIIKQVEILRAQKREAIRQADHLFDTLLHRAFCGEL